eukprot:446874_1
MSNNKRKGKKKNAKQYTRKNLMQMSLKELQKICKRHKYKLTNTATKLEIVNIILVHNKVIKIQNNVLNPLKKAEYLTSGFVRNHINSISKDKYDEQLSILIAQYIGNIFICFDIFHSKYIETVKSNGCIVQRGNYKFEAIGYKYGNNKQNVCILYASSCAMNKGIHEWNIKVIKNKTKFRSECDIIDAFGVTNKIDLCTQNENIFHILNDWKLSDDIKNSLFTYNFCTENESGWTPKYHLYLKEKDVIKVVLDCIQWTLQFQVNGKLDQNAKLIHLKPNCIYYPVILSRRNNTKYKIIPT